MTTTTTNPLPSEDSPEESPALLGAVLQLSADVVQLTKRLTISDSIARTTRRLSLAVAMILAVVVVGGSINQFRIASAVSGNTTNAIQSCQNANETRSANLALWTTILGYVKADSKSNNTVDPLLTWVTVLYAPHDCNDLSRVYKIPPPPVMGAAK